ncbi:MAG: tetratricopeptide repeat protein [Dehalococcoidales bacterium]|nr:MAG: tetratricopeptide repeat protein [Dehalococcoidales bacterium]
MHRTGNLPTILCVKKTGITLLYLILIYIILLTPLSACKKAPVNEILQREITLLEEEVAQNPNDLNKKIDLALLYSDAGLHNKAESELRAVLELEDSHQGALLALGYVYINMESYQAALEPYGKIVELNKDNPMRYISRQLESVYYYMGVAYFNLDDYENAILSLQEALVIDRTDADAWYMLGNACRHSEDFQGAIESFQQAVRFVPDFKEAYQGLALCYKETGQAELALYAQAMVDYCSGMTDKAISQMEQVVSVNQNFAEVYLGLGLAYEKKGEIDKAIDAYEQASILNPDLWLAQAKAEALRSR